jgi:hypothetical protein
MSTLVLIALAGALLLAVWGALKRDTLTVGLALCVALAALLAERVL